MDRNEHPRAKKIHEYLLLGQSQQTKLNLRCQRLLLTQHAAEPGKCIMAKVIKSGHSLGAIFSVKNQGIPWPGTSNHPVAQLYRSLAKPEGGRLRTVKKKVQEMKTLLKLKPCYRFQPKSLDLQKSLKPSAAQRMQSSLTKSPAKIPCITITPPLA